MEKEALTTAEQALPAVVDIPDSEEFGVRKVEADVIRDEFLPLVMKMTELEEEAAAIVAEEEITKKLSRRAREVRLAYKRIRVDVAKEYKAYYLAGGRYVDAWRRVQHDVSEARESKLQEVETHFERIRAAEIAALEKERRGELAALDFHTDMGGLGEMEPDVYAALLDTAKKQYEAEREAERRRREEEERQREEARRRYREAAAERARLEQEAEVMRKKAAEEAAARRRAEDALRKKEEEAEALRLAEERRRREAEEAEKAKGDAEKYSDFLDALRQIQDMGPFESERYGTAYRWACVQFAKIEHEVMRLATDEAVA